MPEPENDDVTMTNPPAAENPEGAAADKATAPASEAAAQLAAAKAEAAANYDKFMRAAADLENFRRRTVREKDDLRTTATGRVLEDIFPVLDNLALAIQAAKQPGADVKTLVGGVEM